MQIFREEIDNNKPKKYNENNAVKCSQRKR